MGDGALTQEEIDRLLQGADDSAGTPAAPASTMDDSFDAAGGVDSVAGQIVEDGLKSSIQGLSLLLSATVNLGAPRSSIVSQDDIERDYGINYLALTQQCSGTLSFSFGLFFPVQMGATLSGMIMGGEAATTDISQDAARMASLKEALGPLLFAIVNQISVGLGGAITPQAAEASVTGGAPFPLQGEPSYLSLDFPLSVEGSGDSTITVILPRSVSEELETAASRVNAGASVGGAMSGVAESAAPEESGGEPMLPLKDVNFPGLPGGTSLSPDANLNLLMDVQMTLTVELGRTKMYIKEILALGEGSIIELDKLAGEPVDLLVNGKLIAKGEVVVIDENFGVRVTDIVSPVERLSHKQK